MSDQTPPANKSINTTTLISDEKKNESIVDKDVVIKSSVLDSKRIALGVCGGIGSVEIVKIARELRRHGAVVHAFFTPSVSQFITEMSAEWATGNKVVTALDADVDHLEDFDLVAVIPATLNTLAKCSVGISDNAVTLLVSGQLGRRGRVLFVPTMNMRLRRHPAFEEHKSRLESWGATLFLNQEEEGRLKMPSPGQFVEEVRKRLK